MRRFRYLDVLTTCFVVILLVSNLVAQKDLPHPTLQRPWPPTRLFHLRRHAALPHHLHLRRRLHRGLRLRRLAPRHLAGLLRHRAALRRRAIVIALPADPDFHNQQAFVTVFGILPRILVASLIAFWAGEFANSYTMAKLKLITNGRWLWTRTVGSTVVGQAVDTTLVIILTFAGTYSAHNTR